MKTPKYRIALWVAFAAAALFFSVRMGILPLASARPVQRYAAPHGFQFLDIVFQLIRDDYLEERDPVQTAEGAYRGMVNSLDSLSSYLPKDLSARYLARRWDDKDAGLILYKKYGTFPLIVAVVPDSPAAKAGIETGDVLTAVAHRNTLSMSLTEVDLLLKTNDDAPLPLKVLRGNEALEKTITRASLFPHPYVVARQPGRPAILTIRYFSPGLAAEIVKDVLPSLKAQKKPLVLDLRTAAEGDLEEALALANLFVKADPVGSFEKRGGAKVPVACRAAAELAGLPLVVWTGPATMGPAELVAGVLQEVRKAKIVGTETSGLVARRELFPLDDESSMLLVTETFSLPSGRSLWGKGVQPDAAVQARDQSEKAYLEKTLPLLPKT